MKIRNGTTRFVILTKHWAFKIPQFRYAWRHFLMGLLANMQERQFATMKDSRMCPIKFYIPGGWLVVMPRCKELSDEDFTNLNIDMFWEESNVRELKGTTIFFGDFKIPVEHKQDSFGWLNGKIVAIDYGS